MYVAISWEGWPETRRGGSGRGEEEGGHASSWLTRLARSGRCLLPHRRASPPRRACPRADRPTPARHARRPPLRGMSLEAIRLELRRRAEEERAAVDGNNELLRRRRADAVWVDISDARHPVVEVHEIKVTKADLEAELRRPEKSAPWMQRAHKFWLTIPEPHLANDVSVPDTWGILALPFGGPPHVVRAAPALTPTVPYASRLAEFDGERWLIRCSRYTIASRTRAVDVRHAAPCRVGGMHAEARVETWIQTCRARAGCTTGGMSGHVGTALRSMPRLASRAPDDVPVSRGQGVAQPACGQLRSSHEHGSGAMAAGR